MLHYIMLRYILSPCSGHVTLCHVTICHVTKCHLTICQIAIRHVTICHVTISRVTICDVMIHHVTICHAMICHTLYVTLWYVTCHHTIHLKYVTLRYLTPPNVKLLYVTFIYDSLIGFKIKIHIYTCKFVLAQLILQPSYASKTLSMMCLGNYAYYLKVGCLLRGNYINKIYCWNQVKVFSLSALLPSLLHYNCNLQPQASKRSFFEALSAHPPPTLSIHPWTRPALWEV